MLEVPVLPEYVSTARLFIAAVGRSIQLDEELVADLKMAVSEACTGAIQTENGDSKQPVRISVLMDESRLTVEVFSAGRFAPRPDQASEPETPTELFQKALGIGVIHSLFPDVEVREEPQGGSSLVLQVPRA